MSAYLISRANVESLDTLIFAAGPNDKEEAVAVFTNQKSAETYIKEAGWEGQYTVAVLESIPFFRWLLRVYDEGVQHIAIDPNYADQQSGVRLNTLSVEAHLEHAGQHIIDVARPDF